MRSVLSFLCACLILAFPLAGAAGPETSWNGGSGNWADAGNWSGGEPVADCPARIPSGTVTVNQADEACASLHVGAPSGSLVQIQFQGGSLMVGGLFAMEGAVGTHSTGAVTAGRLEFGLTRTGSYTMFGGSIEAATAAIGAVSQAGSYSISSGAVTITDSLHVGRGGGFLISGNAVDASLGHVRNDGVFAVVSRPRPIVAESFHMDPQARLHATVTIGGISLIDVSGPASIAGTLQIMDLQDIPDGAYEFVRGNPLSGEFTALEIPADSDWSWTIEGNSLYLLKGDASPVEPSSWTRVKTGGSAGR